MQQLKQNIEEARKQLTIGNVEWSILLLTLCIEWMGAHLDKKPLKSPKQTIDSLTFYYGNDKNKVVLIEKGVKQAASLWDSSDGNAAGFITFCKENYASNN